MSDQHSAKPEPTPLRDMPALKPVASNDLTDVARLMGTGERLLVVQEEAKLKQLSAYEQAQLAITDKFRQRAAAAVRERDEAMRALDKQHEAKMSDIERSITKLKALRDA